MGTMKRLVWIIWRAMEHEGRVSDDVTAASTFEELGLDSLDMADILTAAEDEFGVEMTGEALRDVETVGGLWGVISERSGGAAQGVQG